jgi:hypothetical protein
MAPTIPIIEDNSLEPVLFDPVPLEDKIDLEVNEEETEDVVLFDPTIFPL